MENLWRPELATDWVAWYFIGLLAVFAWLRSRDFGQFLSTSYDALFLFQPPLKLQNKSLSSIESILVLCLQQVNISLILTQVFNLTSIQFWVCATLLCVFLGLRVASFHYLGYIFKQDYVKKYSIFQFLYFELTLFYILLAICLPLYFFNLEPIYSVYLLMLMSVLYIFLKFRIGFQIFVKLRVRVFYIFLYFCALEFTPLLWGYYFLK